MKMSFRQSLNIDKEVVYCSFFCSQSIFSVWFETPIRETQMELKTNYCFLIMTSIWYFPFIQAGESSFLNEYNLKAKPQHHYKQIKCVPSSVNLASLSNQTLILWVSVRHPDARTALLLTKEKTTLLAKGIIPTAKLISVPVNLIKFTWFDIFKTVLPKTFVFLSTNVFLSVRTCTKEFVFL